MHFFNDFETIDNIFEAYNVMGSECLSWYNVKKVFFNKSFQL